MTDYTELVKALRCGEYKPECGSSDCPYWSGLGCMDGQLMEDAADAIEKLVTLYEKAEIDATNHIPTASPWHRVEDGLPEKATWVLTIAKELNVTIFNIATVDAGGQWWTTSPHKIMRELYGVRYWMPIEPPKEDA